jgi:Reverse transcriptase (RNA-dependent DNA polymerase)
MEPAPREPTPVQSPPPREPIPQAARTPNASNQPRRPPEPAPQRRSQRSTKGIPAPRFDDTEEFNILAATFEDWTPDRASCPSELIAAFVASASDPDTLRYDEALRDPDCEAWKEAMQKEISSLVKQGTWEIVNKSDADSKILPGTWTLRRKRNPDGTVKSLKARWCVRGDLQGFVPDTFAPVVAWATVRLLMYFTLFFGLHTRCIDFSNAFVQAPLDTPIFVHLPRGYHNDGGPEVCLKLVKSLYGIAQAPRLWFEHLKDKLEKRGFKQSKLDPCLFYSGKIYLVCYVDDIVMASTDVAALEALILDLKADSDLTEEGELSAFLGIQVDREEGEDGKGPRFTLTQPGLTTRIIDALGLTDANPAWTPTTQESLGSGLDSPLADESWSYRSLIGMLLYLSNNSRPDIAFAVHQCARFSHAPRQVHAAAVKAIGRYLIRTRDKGLIMSPTGDLGVDCYVDADFAGLWLQEDQQDPLSVKSRTGYLISIGGCPLTWTSKLQTEVALSTMEAEYIALSQSMRELLPIRELVREMSTTMGYKKEFEIRTHSKVFEDNNGALTLASSPRMTPRSKHIAVKYHFFRSHVADGSIKILKIATEEQKADIFTKGLVRAIFESIRLLVMGW